jgi:DNA-binding response OmpR family regulator
MHSEINILVVEDEVLIAQSMKLQLEDFGYHVVKACYTFRSAEQTIAQMDFDILVTDIDLGHGIEERSGIEIAKQVRATKPDCPIIFLTAFGDTNTIKTATTVGPSAYLVKPTNTANLYAAVQLAFENAQLKHPAQLEPESPDYFFTKLGNHLVKIHWKDVYHLEAVKNYVIIKATTHRTGVAIRGSLKQVMEDMLPELFKHKLVKINRSEAILKSSILKIGADMIETTNGQYKVTRGFSVSDL